MTHKMRATSLQVYAEIKEQLPARRQHVLRVIEQGYEKGRTIQEVAKIMDCESGSISGRFTELNAMDMIINTHTRRQTKSGKAASVWVALKYSGMKGAA